MADAGSQPRGPRRRLVSQTRTNLPELAAQSMERVATLVYNFGDHPAGVSAAGNAMHATIHECLAQFHQLGASRALLRYWSVASCVLGCGLFAGLRPRYMVVDQRLCLRCAFSKNTLGQWSSVLRLLCCARERGTAIFHPPLLADGDGLVASFHQSTVCSASCVLWNPP